MDIELDLDGLRVSLPELRRFADERTKAARRPGAAARVAGQSIDQDPHPAGTWMSTRWLEGWSGALAPERVVVLGKGFNMTPAEEYFGRMQWMAGIGVAPPRIREALRGLRRCYDADELPPEQ